MRGVDGRCRDAVRDSIGQPLAALAFFKGEPAVALASAVGSELAVQDLQLHGGDRVWRISLAPSADGGFVCAGRDITPEAAALAARDAAENAATADRGAIPTGC